MNATPDSTLANPEHLIADLQRQLAESRAERDEAQRQLAERTIERDDALAQQIGTAEVLQVINSSPGDLAPVFDAILEKAHTLCGVEFGSLQAFDGEQFRAAATRGLPEAFAELLRGGYRPLPGSPAEPLLRGEHCVHIADMTALLADSTPAVARRLRLSIDLAGTRTLLLVPLRRDGVLIGCIGAYRKEVRPFTDKEIALLQNFAAQAVIAMENARLLTETREALEQQTATADVLQVINSSPGDLAPVFDAILEKAHTLCGASHGALVTYDGEYFRAVATHELPAPFADLLRQPFRPEPASPQAPLLRGEHLVHMPDASALHGPGWDGPRTRAAREAGLRALLMLPLRKDTRLLGYITANRHEPGPFTDKQIALLQNFAAQAVIAMENARLLTETREALEQQTATAEVLEVINSSPGDLGPVFDAMLEKATRLCGATYGQIATYDGEFFRFVAKHGEAPFLRQHPTGLLQPTVGVTWQRIVDGAPLVHIHDLAETDLYCSGHESARALVDIGRSRTLLTIALRKDDTLLGTITVYRQEVLPFTDKQISLLENFAAQAVIAMENARLITETREALEQQTATAEVLGVINASPGDLTPVFDAILEKAHNLCGVEYGSLRLYEGEKFRAVATRGYPEKFDQLVRHPHSLEPYSPVRALLHGEPLVEIPDVMAHQAETPNTMAEAAIAIGIRSVLFLPLRRDGLLLGVISAGRKEARAFLGKEIALLQNFAAQAVIAMENARLITETREALEQQTATAEVLGVINSSPGEVTPVFDAMLEKAIRLCGANHGILFTYDGECFHLGATHGSDPRFVEWARQLGPLKPPASGTYRGAGLARISRGERLVHIADVRETDAFQAAEQPIGPGAQLLVRFGVRSYLGVALRRDDTLLGAIVIYRREVRPFSEKQIALLQNFAAQAVIAMENARLLGELRQRTDEVAELNRGLEARVAEQVDELGRVGRLKRFLAPQLAELIVSHGDEKILESHRREIVVVFCDLRGYTAFTETAEPEEVLEFLRQYHGALGPLVTQFEGTLDQFSGDGIMVFFNDPLPCPDPAERAVKMAMAMREAAGKLITAWRRHGSELGFGVGIAQGYATLGQIGFTDRSGYTAIGTVCNLASRLCAGAKDGQILVSSRIAEAVEAVVKLEDLGELELRGLRRPVAAFNVGQSTSAPDARPNLTVVARGPGSN